MKVLVADAINEKGIEILEENVDVVVNPEITPEELLKTISEYEGIIIRSRTKVTKEVIQAADNLKIIARAGVGVDNVDINAATEKGIMVVNSPESTSITVAEHTMGLMLSLARKLSIADKSVKEGKWEKKRFMGIELRNKTLGVVGMGKIGSQVVKRCESFEMSSIVYDPYLPEEVAETMGVKLVDLETLLKEADFITVHVPLTPETENLISTEEFKIMKEDSYIMNCARGGIIDEDALYIALKNNEIGGCALDVYVEEPPKNSKLFELDNIVLTPHIAASTKEAQRDAAIIVAEEIISLSKNDTPKNILNLPRIDNQNEFAPYLELCLKLGSFISQAVKGRINEIEIIYGGEVGELSSQEILTRTIIQGILSPYLKESITTVNAPIIAKERGISVTEGIRNDGKGYNSIIKVSAINENERFSVEGTILHDPKILKVNNYWVDVKPEGHMFIAKYEDVPGTIGTIGTLLGQNDINIGIMQVGREIDSGKAIMILTLDQEIPNELIDELLKLDNVDEAVKVNL